MDALCSQKVLQLDCLPAYTEVNAFHAKRDSRALQINIYHKHWGFRASLSCKGQCRTIAREKRWVLCFSLSNLDAKNEDEAPPLPQISLWMYGTFTIQSFAFLLIITPNAQNRAHVCIVTLLHLTLMATSWSDWGSDWFIHRRELKRFDCLCQSSRLCMCHCGDSGTLLHIESIKANHKENLWKESSKCNIFSRLVNWPIWHHAVRTYQRSRKNILLMSWILLECKSSENIHLDLL